MMLILVLGLFGLAQVALAFWPTVGQTIKVRPEKNLLETLKKAGTEPTEA